MDPHSPNKLFATKYCFLILVDQTSFFVFISFLFFFFLLFLFLLFYVIINFYKNHFIIIFLFFMIFLFLFFHVPGCSGIFRNVPALECSVFRVLSTPPKSFGPAELIQTPILIPAELNMLISVKLLRNNNLCIRFGV